MDNPKQFMALVNGVFMRTFQRDESITPDLLKEQVFPGDSPTVERTFLHTFYAVSSSLRYFPFPLALRQAVKRLLVAN